MVRNEEYWAPRDCLREPVPELYDCAALLERAVEAHLFGDRDAAASLFREADIPAARDWIESLWGGAKDWPEQVHYKRLRKVDHLPDRTPKQKDRMPGRTGKLQLVERDGFNCRYCGIPVIPAEVRMAVSKDYPELAIWGRRNAEQHAGFQALWLQYDHVLPAALGGNNELSNMVISCAGCNFCKWNYHLQEMGLNDPFSRSVEKSEWDGLLRYIGGFERWRP